jgi:hypothetical protein
MFDLEMYTIGGLEIWVGMFKALKMILALNSFSSFVRLFFLIGFVATFIARIIAKNDFKGFMQYAVLNTIIFFAALGLQANILVIDTTKGISSGSIGIVGMDKVDGVPLFPALMASLFSSFDYTLTKAIDDAFSGGTFGTNPTMTKGYLELTMGGMQKSLQGVSKFNFKLPNSESNNFDSALREYLEGCFYPDLAVFTDSEITTMLESDDLFAAISPKTPNRLVSRPNILETKYPGVLRPIDTCENVYLTLEVYKNDPNFNNWLAGIVIGTDTTSEITTMLGVTQAQLSNLSNLTGGAASTEQCLLNAGIYSSINTYLTGWASSNNTDIDALMTYGLGKQRMNQWMESKSIWVYFLEVFPKYVTSMKAVLIFLTPIALLMVMMPGTGLKIVGGIIMGLLSVYLYNPIAATLNGFGNIIYLQQAQLGLIGTSKLCSAYGLSKVALDLNDYLSIFGIMSMSIPAIALFLTTGSVYAFVNSFGAAQQISQAGKGATSSMVRTDNTDAMQDIGMMKASSAMGMSYGQMMANTGVYDQQRKGIETLAKGHSLEYAGSQHIYGAAVGETMKTTANGIAAYNMLTNDGEYGAGSKEFLQRWDRLSDAERKNLAYTLGRASGMSKEEAESLGNIEANKAVGLMQAAEKRAEVLFGSKEDVRKLVEWQETGGVVTEDLAKNLDKHLGDGTGEFFQKNAIGTTLSDWRIDNETGKIESFAIQKQGHEKLSYDNGVMTTEKSETVKVGGSEFTAQITEKRDENDNFIQKTVQTNVSGLQLGNGKINGDLVMNYAADGSVVFSGKNIEYTDGKHVYNGILKGSLDKDGNIKGSIIDAQSGKTIKELDEYMRSYVNQYRTVSMVTSDETVKGLSVFKQDKDGNIVKVADGVAGHIAREGNLIKIDGTGQKDDRFYNVNAEGTDISRVSMKSLDTYFNGDKNTKEYDRAAKQVAMFMSKTGLAEEQLKTMYNESDSYVDEHGRRNREIVFANASKLSVENADEESIKQAKTISEINTDEKKTTVGNTTMVVRDENTGTYTLVERVSGNIEQQGEKVTASNLQAEVGGLKYNIDFKGTDFKSVDTNLLKEYLSATVSERESGKYAEIREIQEKMGYSDNDLMTFSKQAKTDKIMFASSSEFKAHSGTEQSAEGVGISETAIINAYMTEDFRGIKNQIVSLTNSGHKEQADKIIKMLEDIGTKHFDGIMQWRAGTTGEEMRGGKGYLNTEVGIKVFGNGGGVGAEAFVTEGLRNTESEETSLNREYITTVTDKLREIIADGKVTNEELDKADESFTELGIYDNALRETAKSYNSENSGAFASFGMLKENMIKGFEKMQKLNVGTGGPSTNEIHLAFENANSIEEARENLRKLKNKNVSPETVNKNVSPKK